MPDIDKDGLTERVQGRLKDLNMTVAEATRRAQLPKDFIYDLLNGRKKSIGSSRLRKLAKALDCDYNYLEGLQDEISTLDNFVDFDRPPVPIIGDVSTGVFVDPASSAEQDPANDMPNLPPDTRFSPSGQVDLYVRGPHINRFAPSGYILRCLLMDSWKEVIRDGDLLVIDKFRDGLRERAAWRVEPDAAGLTFTTDTSDRKLRLSWRADYPYIPMGEGGTWKPYAMVLFAYSFPRIRRMF